MKHALTFAVATALLAGSATAARAQDDKPVSFSGNVTFVTDYRFRGITLSDKDVAIQGGIDLSTQPGFFVGIWGSSIAEFNGATTEIDLTAGWTGTFEFLTPTIGIIGYLYPGGTNTDYYELFGSLGFEAGPVALEVGLNVAPNQSNLSRSNRYLYFGASAGIPDTPITLKGQLGFERGGLVPDETGTRTTKTDWLIGADISFEPLTIGFAYTDTNLRRSFPGGGGRANDFGRGAFVVSLSAGF